MALVWIIWIKKKYDSNFGKFAERLSDKYFLAKSKLFKQWANDRSLFLYDRKNFAVVLCYDAVVGVGGVSVCRQVGFRMITFVPVGRIIWYFVTLILTTR